MVQRLALCAALVAYLLVAPPPVLAEQVTITGAVSGPDGAPVPDCTVGTLHPPAEGGREWEWAETTTDAQGRFRLAFDCPKPPHPYTVSAAREGFALGWERVSQDGGEVAVKLTADPASIHGSLADPQNKPIAGVAVWVSRLSIPDAVPRNAVAFSDREPVLQTRSDENGRFSFTGLPAAAKVWLKAGGDGWARALGSGLSAPEGGAEVTITLQPEARISGCVTRNGKALPGAVVIAQPSEFVGIEWAETRSGDDGIYLLQALPAGVYQVKLSTSQGYLALPHEGLELGPGSIAENIDFELIEGAVVEGTVTLQDTGEPAVGASVYVMEPAPSSAETDQAGHYRLRVAPGRNDLQCVAPRELWGEYDLPEPSHVWVEVEEGQVKPGIDFVLKPQPVFRGVCLGADHEPVSDAQVWVLQAGYPKPDDSEPPQRTDAQGRFSVTERGFRGLAPWLIFGYHIERGLAGLVLAEGPRAEMTVELEPAGYVTVEALDLEGDPVPGVRMVVQVEREGAYPLPLPGPYVTDEQGQLRIGPLPPRHSLEIWPASGAERLAVNSPWREFRQCSLQPGETRKMGALRLNPAGRTLEGVVVDEQQQPVAGATVMRTWMGLSEGPREEAVTQSDAEGRFTLSGLQARGEATIVALSPDSRLAAALRADPDLETDVVLTLREPAAVQGVVYDGAGRAAAGVKIGLSGWGGGFALNGEAARKFKRWQTRRSDERGRYRFEGLVPGLTHGLSYLPPGSNAWQRADDFKAESGEGPVVVDVYMD